MPRIESQCLMGSLYMLLLLTLGELVLNWCFSSTFTGKQSVSSLLSPTEPVTVPWTRWWPPTDRLNPIQNADHHMDTSCTAFSLFALFFPPIFYPIKRVVDKPHSDKIKKTWTTNKSTLWFLFSFKNQPQCFWRLVLRNKALEGLLPCLYYYIITFAHRCLGAN